VSVAERREAKPALADPSHGKSFVFRLALLAAFPATLVLVWWLVAASVDSAVLNDPLEAFGQILASLQSPRYLESLLVTAQTVAIAYIGAVLAGSLVGFALGLSTFWRNALGPLVQAIYSIPKITVFPLFLVFLGLSLTSRIAFAFVHGFFPIVIIIMGATANLRMNEIYLKLGASLKMSHLQLVRIVLLPAVLPSFLTAARLGFGLTFLGAILAEMFSSNGGLGHELIRNMYDVRVDRILAQVVLIAIIAIIPNAVLRMVEVRISRRMQGIQ